MEAMLKSTVQFEIKKSGEHLFENLDNIGNDKNTQKEILDFSRIKQISWGTL